ncbi:MAG: DUF5674 family protein [Patescibacteria group bacterium]
MEIINSKIKLEKLKKISKKMFGNLVKVVVDIKKKIMAINAELHSDEEALLLENGSDQKNLWGVNIYPNIQDESWIEFDSMMNLRPSQNNRSRGIDNLAIQKKIIKIINNLVIK